MSTYCNIQIQCINAMDHLIAHYSITLSLLVPDTLTLCSYGILIMVISILGKDRKVVCKVSPQPCTTSNIFFIDISPSYVHHILLVQDWGDTLFSNIIHLPHSHAQVSWLTHHSLKRSVTCKQTRKHGWYALFMNCIYLIDDIIECE